MTMLKQSHDARIFGCTKIHFWNWNYWTFLELESATEDEWIIEYRAPK